MAGDVTARIHQPTQGPNVGRATAILATAAHTRAHIHTHTHVHTRVCGARTIIYIYIHKYIIFYNTYMTGQAVLPRFAHYYRVRASFKKINDKEN